MIDQKAGDCDNCGNYDALLQAVDNSRTGRSYLCHDCAPTQTVALIASGYEWVCPRCRTFNREIEVTERVICSNCLCMEEYDTQDHYHAYG